MDPTKDKVGNPGPARNENGWPIVTTLNVLSVVPLALVSSIGWFLLLIGIADQGGTAKAYLSGGASLFLPWLFWLGSVVASQWLRSRAYVLACIVAGIPLVAEIALYLQWRSR